MRVSIVAIVVLSAFGDAACGPQTPPSAAATKAAVGDAGTHDAGPVEPERPFAGSTAEATSLISDAVDKKHIEIAACIRSFRSRKNMAKERVAVSFGIDQEGRLLGVTAKGKEDTELKDCITAALKAAPLPRSHSGVITVTKTYEELVL